MAKAYIGLGSNVGDRLANLSRAVELLSAKGITVVRKSSVYETAPVGYEDQPDFLNAVVEIETEQGPSELLATTKGVENEMRRVRGVRWGPRNIDLDILLYGDMTIKADGLELPHREVKNRAFVLVPLAEIAGEFMHPVGKTVSQLRDGLGDFSGIAFCCGADKW